MKPLAEYHRKRNFEKTKEPAGGASKPAKSKKGKLIFVVQEHHASHLHYDFRLEWEGVLKSWAVPKGPSLDPGQKRLAVQTEDHPIEYAKFTGVIPKGEYGAGKVYRWDLGHWRPLGDVNESLRKGRLEFSLEGTKLSGTWILVRTGRSSGSKTQWLLIKRHDTKGAVARVTRGPARTKAAPTSAAKLEKAGRLEFVPPQLARLVDRTPEGDDWVHEVKYDGYRIQAHLDRGRVKLYTRSGLDWTDKYPTLAKAFAKIDVEDAIVDGELVWQDADGRSDFQKLQNVMKDGRTEDLVYWAFDLLRLDGEDVRSLPLIARKDRLRKLFKKNPKNSPLLFSDHFREDGRRLFKATCAMDLEGVISKRVDGTYVSGRRDDWVKSKCSKRQEFVIGGFSEGQGSRSGFGALLLGVYEEGELRYAGRVGTGFNQKSLADITKKLKKLAREKSPFAIKSPRGRDLSWIEPKLVCEVTFAEWTSEGSLRAPSFQGLRLDKDPKTIVAEHEKKVVADHVAEEKPKASATKKRASTKRSRAPEIKVTHPERLVYPHEKITKLEVAQYYAVVAEKMLEAIAQRPLSLLRCTSDPRKPCFYSKHFPNDKFPAGVLEIPEAGKPSYFTVDSPQGLASLIQYGAVEIHPWNCHGDDIERPDQIVMDFDPDEKITFAQVKEGAFALRDLLSDLDIESFVKVTGGKGVHVQFPFEPLYDWTSVKSFAKTLVHEMSSRFPDLYTANVAKKARGGKIFLDYLRNGRGATAVAPYSLRSRDVSAVAMPIGWAELKKLDAANHFDLRTALEYLARRRKDPWAGYGELEQTIKVLKPLKR